MSEEKTDFSDRFSSSGRTTIEQLHTDLIESQNDALYYRDQPHARTFLIHVLDLIQYLNPFVDESKFKFRVLNEKGLLMTYSFTDFLQHLRRVIMLKYSRIDASNYVFAVADVNKMIKECDITRVHVKTRRMGLMG